MNDPQKTINYRKVVWSKQVAHRKTLQKVFSNALSKMSDEKHQPYLVDEQVECVIFHKYIREDYVFFHLIEYDQESRQAVVPVRAPGKNINEILPPDSDTEFIKSQLFILIADDKVFYVSHNETIRDSKVKRLLDGSLGSIEKNSENQNYNLMAVLDKETISQMLEQGVKIIHLNIGNFQSVIESINGEKQSSLSSIFSVFERRQTAQERETAADLQATISLKIGHKWRNEDLKQVMSNIAFEVQKEYDDEFLIETSKGAKFTRDKMMVSWSKKIFGSKHQLAIDSVRLILVECLNDFKTYS